MFDFAWTEIALIGVVALVAIGPKDLPVAIKTVASMIKKARRMAGEFQTHFDEMVREANLGDLKSQINDIRNFDVKGAIEKAIDGDGTLRSNFDNPMAPSWTPPVNETAIEPHGDHVITAPDGSAPDGSALDESAPPEIVPGEPLHGAEVEAAEATAAAYVPPAFIPPAIANRPAPPAFIPPAAARS